MGRLTASYRAQCVDNKVIRSTPTTDQVKVGKKDKGKKNTGPWILECHCRKDRFLEAVSKRRGWHKWDSYKNERSVMGAYNVFRRKWQFYNWRVINPNGVVIAEQILTEEDRELTRHGLHPDYLK